MTFTVLQGDALHLPLADGSVHCCVTSPPYWNLRDYNVPGQLGLEPTPEEYVANMVAVFREVWRVLRPDGTVWLNLGSSYVSRQIASDEMVLRDDLTQEERRYVLEELAVCRIYPSAGVACLA